VQLVQTWLGNGLVGQSHGVKPHITLITSVDEVQAGFPGELVVPGYANPVLVNGDTVKRMLCDASVTELSSAGSVVDRHAHLHDGVPCHGPAHPRRSVHTQAQHGLGLLHPVTGCELNADSARLLRRRHHVWEEGRRYRTVPPRMRRALEIRDRHCAFPGCRIGIGWCQAHHILEWDDGGETNLDNLTLICSRHHHAVHEGGWTIVKNPGIHPGCPTWITFEPPDPHPPRTQP
jgi:5-methylcytosine-specific restriction endonuclease McrA